MVPLDLFHFFLAGWGGGGVCLKQYFAMYVRLASEERSPASLCPPGLGLEPSSDCLSAFLLVLGALFLIQSSALPWSLFVWCPQEPLKSLRPRKVSTPASSSQKAREEKTLLPLELQDDGSDSESTSTDTLNVMIRCSSALGLLRLIPTDL